MAEIASLQQFLADHHAGTATAHEGCLDLLADRAEMLSQARQVQRYLGYALNTSEEMSNAARAQAIYQAEIVIASILAAAEKE